MKENAEKARGLDAAEIAKTLKEGAEQMFRIRFQMSMGQPEGLKKLLSLKKERARMLTVLRERELKGDAAPVVKPTVASKKASAPKAAAPKTAAKKVPVKKTVANKVAVKAK